jgi:hypothetical protein
MREVTRPGRQKIKNMERRENHMGSLVRRELDGVKSSAGRLPQGVRLS